MQKFEGITAFITGGASGLGFSLAKSLLARGAKTVLADVEQAALDNALMALESYDNRVKGIVCDVSTRESLRGAANEAIEDFGDIQFVFNNAGVGGGGGLMENVPDESWDWTLGVNLVGVISGIQAFVPHMKSHGRPACIVNTASMAGMLGIPGMGPYCATKFAVVALSEALSGELAESNIQVSVLCPGFVKTRIAESNRNRPFELAERPTTPEQQARAKEVLSAIENGLSSDRVAERVLEAVAAGELYIFTHADFADAVAERHDRLQAAFLSAKNSTVLNAD